MTSLYSQPLPRTAEKHVTGCTKSLVYDLLLPSALRSVSVTVVWIKNHYSNIRIPKNYSNNSNSLNIPEPFHILRGYKGAIKHHKGAKNS